MRIFSPKILFLLFVCQFLTQKEIVLSFKFYQNLWCWAVDRSGENSQSML